MNDWENSATVCDKLIILKNPFSASSCSWRSFVFMSSEIRHDLFKGGGGGGIFCN